MENHKIYFISKDSLDSSSKRQCQIAKSRQSLSKVEKKLTSQSKRVVPHSPIGCRSGEQNVCHLTQLSERRQQPEFQNF
jgi:hypothetical protein